MKPDLLSGLGKRPFFAALFAAIVWSIGFACMNYPIGDGLRRMGYDYLHRFTTHPAPTDVLVIAINEQTDRKLGIVQGQPLKRSDHARLLARLTQAGAALVCYDILFDQAAADSVEDEKFRATILDNGHVILGAAEELDLVDRAARSTRVIGPTEKLGQAANGIGLINAGPLDPDGVIRRFNTSSQKILPLAVLAAQKVSPGIFPVLPAKIWPFHLVRPGDIPTLEFADCLAPQSTTDANQSALDEDRFKGKVIFIGGEYSSNANGRPDLIATPFTRFNGQPVFGVAWHAAMFEALRDPNDQRWFLPASLAQNALWSLPFAVFSLGLFRFRSARMNTILSIALAAGLSIAGLCVMWQGRILLNWMVPGVIQFPFCLLGLLCLKLAEPPENQEQKEQIKKLLGELAHLRRKGDNRRIIFLSAATAAFKSHRAALSAVLRSNFEVHGQDELPPIGKTTLIFLDDFIKDSTCVVHLVGMDPGKPASKPAIADLKKSYPDLIDRMVELHGPTSSNPKPLTRDQWETTITYTQWEAYLAEYHSRDMLIAVHTDDPTGPGASGLAPEVGQEPQPEHLSRLRAMGRHVAFTFSSPDQLLVKVLEHLINDTLRGTPPVKGMQSGGFDVGEK